MPRPRMFCCSSITTALVVVEPRSMPMKQRMVISFSAPYVIGMNVGCPAPTPEVRFCLTIWK